MLSLMYIVLSACYPMMTAGQHTDGNSDREISAKAGAPGPLVYTSIWQAVRMIAGTQPVQTVMSSVASSMRTSQALVYKQGIIATAAAQQQQQISAGRC
jgi:hypothetical protein